MTAPSRRGRWTLVAAALAIIGVVAACGPVEETESSETVVMDVYLAGTDLKRNAGPPEAVQQNLLAGDIYGLGGTPQAPEPAGEPIGRFVGECTVVTSSERGCTGFVMLDGRGTITVQVGVVGGINQGIAATGGTGEFSGATGSGVEPPVPGRPADRVLELEFELEVAG